MSPLKSSILEAARANAIPEGESGLWHVKKLRLAKPFFIARPNSDMGETLPPGEWTSLFRFTDATIHLHCGELVMHDFPHELRTHLDFMLRAQGDVLVSGLGLGCVARGLLANPAVRSVTVLENSPDVLNLVGKYMSDPSHPSYDARLEIIYAEAEDWLKKTDRKFDCAWHDLWTDTSAGEPHLIVKHASLLSALAGRVRFQGCWNFPREQRRAWRAIANVI